MDRAEFEKLVREAILALPREIRAKMDNVAVVIEDEASAQQLRKGGIRGGGILLGLYEGVPRTRRGPGYTLVLPDKITIFQKAIEMIAQTPEQIKAQVRSTVWHEIAHHFGFSEGQVQKLARKRGKT